MIRRIVAVCICLAMLVSLVVIVSETVPNASAPTTIYVDDVPGQGPGNPPENYTSIQAAIDNADEGDTVFVYNGTYYENILVNKTITLAGESKSSTIIDGQGLDTTIYITSDWVNITGFTINCSNGTTSKSAVLFHEADHCSISNNIIFNGNRGVHSWYSSHNTVSGNHISNNTEGIFNYHSHYINITKNTIENNEYAMYIQSSMGNEIHGNSMTGNGIFIRGDILNEWNTHNIDSLNTVNGKPVYALRNTNGGSVPKGAGQVILANCADIAVENQTLENGTVGVIIGFSSRIYIVDTDISGQYYGFYITNCEETTIFRCSITGSSDVGIRITKSDESTFRDNLVSGNGMGVYHMDCSRSNILDNDFILNGDGLYIHGGTKNRVSSNNISQNTDESLLCVNGNNMVISENDVWSNYIGLRFISQRDSFMVRNRITSNTLHGINYQVSRWNTISDNDVTDNSRGIYFSQSTNNTVMGNNFHSNFEYGIYIYLSKDNIIHHNNLIDNTNQSYDDSVNDNRWDNNYPSGGNYWSDYSGVDDFSGPDQDEPGGDGIGDTNYSIDGDSADNYPLINPYKDHTFLMEGWNLISIPLIQTDENLGEVLKTINDSYDAVQWYDCGNKKDPWKHNCVGRPIGNDLFGLNETMGFWIHITEPDGILFKYPGTFPMANTTIQLHPGWNHVGYPSPRSYNRTFGLNDLDFGVDVDCIQWFDGASKNWHSMDPDDFFVPGRGYWMHSLVETTWEVPL